MVAHASTGSPHNIGSPRNPTADTNNPFDHIRQTCTTLFTNLTDKITLDLQKNAFPYGYAQPAPAPPSATSNNVRVTSSVSPPSPSPPPQQEQPQPSMRPTPTAPVTETAGPSTSNFGQTDPQTDTSSSFEEIGAVGGQSPDDWQFVMTKERRDKDQNSEKLCKIKHSIDQIDKLLGEKRLPPKRINRRRSDSDVRSVDDDIRDCLFDEEIKRYRKSCEKCNEAGEMIRKRISEFRQRLELPSVTEDQNREILDDFLRYLETSSKVSVPHTPEEAELCEEIRSAAEIPTQTDNDPQPSGSGGTHPQSPLERIPFDPNQRVDLTDINSLADFDLLTVKQLKEILALNRVDFKGCCEKKELKERVIRLWTNHTALPKPDDLPADDLCKICMDAPIECVLLECGHLVACVKCSKVLSECPICRAYIVRIVRFFRV